MGVAAVAATRTMPAGASKTGPACSRLLHAARRERIAGPIKRMLMSRFRYLPM
jgi:hypothetical protein